MIIENYIPKTIILLIFGLHKSSVVFFFIFNNYKVPDKFVQTFTFQFALTQTKNGLLT